MIGLGLPSTPKGVVRMSIKASVFHFVVRKQLQVSRRAKLLSLEGGGSKSKKPVEFIKKGRDFHFSDLPSWMGVSLVSMSARGRDTDVMETDVGGTADIKAVQDWIGKLCQ